MLLIEHQLRSTRGVTGIEGRDYFTWNYEKIIVRPNMKVTYVSGVHGLPDGRIYKGTIGDSNSDDFVPFDREQIKFLEKSKHCDKRDQIDNMGVKFSLLDISPYCEQDAIIDKEGLGCALRAEKADVLILAFCHSHASVMNTFLTQIGVYPLMALAEDKLYITSNK